MKDMKQFILKPTIEAILAILHMENCKVNGIEGVPNINKLSINPNHFDLEFNATTQAIPQSVNIEYLPEIILEAVNSVYKIPQNTAYFEGNIIIGSKNEQHFDIRFNKPQIRN